MTTTAGLFSDAPVFQTVKDTTEHLDQDIQQDESAEDKKEFV